MTPGKIVAATLCALVVLSMLAADFLAV